MSPKVVAVIPARAGTKRLPSKNKRLFAGKPLICWTIDTALECAFIDKIIVSTDDFDIINICQERYELDFKVKIVERPPELSQDDTPIKDVILSLGLDDWDEVILLQPTSPLRTPKDIFNCHKVWKMNMYGNAISCSFDGNKTYTRNGAIYIWVPKWIRINNFYSIFTNVYLMPEERSIDIDTLEDFYKAEKIMKRRIEKK